MGKESNPSFNKGDSVVMVNCMEADVFKGKIWKCTSDSFLIPQNRSNAGEEVVFLDGFSGQFMCSFLVKIPIPTDFDIIQKFADDNRVWTDEVFGDLSTVATLEHLKEEIGEVIKAIEENQPLSDKLFEFADCYLLFLNAMNRENIPFKLVHSSGIAKMEINRKRKWGKRHKKGYVKHIE